MIRIFLGHEQLQSKQVTITGDEARHLALVLKVHPGETVTVFDGTGYRYNCRILQCRKKEVIAECVSKEPYSAESPLSITLVQGLPKGEKMDLIIQKSTELGVTKIIPVITAFSQIRHTHKMSRWQKIALSASQQSGRDRVPEIDEPIPLERFLSCTLPPANIILSEVHKEQNLKKVLSQLKGTAHITLLVGPEGGFSREETSSAVAKGFMEVSLGPRILRTETAPLAAISIIQYELGDAG